MTTPQGFCDASAEDNATSSTTAQLPDVPKSSLPGTPTDQFQTPTESMSPLVASLHLEGASQGVQVGAWATGAKVALAIANSVSGQDTVFETGLDSHEDDFSLTTAMIRGSSSNFSFNKDRR